MAKLSIRTTGKEPQSIQFRLGTNRLDRCRDPDSIVIHPTVSSHHCELVLTPEGVMIRDLESTNKIYKGGKAIFEARLYPTQKIWLGDVELIVESNDAQIDKHKPRSRSVSKTTFCPRHPQDRVTHRCTHCGELMCKHCTYHLRRKGSKLRLLLCPICSRQVAPISRRQKAKRLSFLTRLRERIWRKINRTVRVRRKVR